MASLKKLFRSQKSPDHALQDLIEGLKTAAGDKLRAVIVFGSHASGEARTGKSSMNVMALLSVLDKDTLDGLAKTVRSWTDAGHEPPVLMRADELKTMSHALPIEFLDMADHHRVVFGGDPFPELTIDPQRLEFQVEHDLHTLLLRLRRSAALADGDRKMLTEILARSIPGAWTLCRALLRLKGQAGPMTKMEAAKRLSVPAGFEESFVDRLDSFRRLPDPSEAEKLFAPYLDWVEKLLHYARRQTALR